MKILIYMQSDVEIMVAQERHLSWHLIACISLPSSSPYLILDKFGIPAGISLDKERKISQHDRAYTLNEKKNPIIYEIQEIFLWNIDRVLSTPEMIFFDICFDFFQKVYLFF